MSHSSVPSDDTGSGSHGSPPPAAHSWRTGRPGYRADGAEGRSTPGSTIAAPTGRMSWRGRHDFHKQGGSFWLMVRRILLTVAAIALIVLLVRMLLTVNRQVPIVVGSVTNYRPPLAVMPQADEDRMLLASLASSGKSFFPGSAEIFDVSPSLVSATADEMLASLTSTLRQSKPGGPDGNMAIVYLTALGTLDDKGRPCIIPPGNSEDPMGLLEDSYLQVDRLLAGLRDALPERVGILVVLDACRPSTDWPLGVDDGAFTPAVEAFMAGSKLKRLWVLVPAATGQHCYSSAAQGASGAMMEFVRGLRGTADAKPWGDANGRVELRELAAYLADRVDRWALATLGDRQTPVLLTPPSNRDADVAIAWTSTRSPAIEMLSNLEDDNDTWLEERWRAAERLRPTAIRERPLLWASYLHLLMRAEHRRTAGVALRDQQINIDTAIQRFETALTLPLISNARLLPGIRLAYKRSSSVREREDDGVRDWLAAVERYIALDGLRSKTATPPAIAEDIDQWMLRAEAAWLWLVDKCESNAPVDRETVVHWLECVGTRPEGEAFNPGQLHFLRMLTRWADIDDWQRQPEAFRVFIRLVSKSRESVYAQDVRADRIIGTEDLANRGNAAMRAAFDLVFVGGAANIDKAVALSREGIEAFDHRVTLSARKLQALELLDAVRAELPYLVTWWVEELRHAVRQQGDMESGGIGKKPADIVALLTAVEQLEQAVDGMVTAADGEPTLTASVDRLDELCSACETLFGSLKSVFLTDCADLATQAPDSPRTYGRIRRILGVPLVLGDLRMRLLRRADNLDRRQAALLARESFLSEEPLPAVDPAAVVAGWIPWRNQLTHPILPVLATEASGASTLPTSAADLATTVGRQVTAVRSAARSLPAIIADFDRQRAELDVGSLESDAKALALLARGSGVSRRLAAVAGQRSRIAEGTTPTQRYFAAAWHKRLLQHAATTLEEFWGGVEPNEPAYCFFKARVLLEAAGEIVRSNGIRFGDRDRDRLAAQINALSSQWNGFATLELTPNRLILPSARDVEPTRNKASLAARPGVPSGLAALWLSESVGGPPLALLRRDTTDVSSGVSRPAPASRTGVRVVPRPEEASWQLDSAAARGVELNRTGVLDMTAWYRGHRMVVGLPVAVAAAARTIEWEASLPLETRITVRGDLPQAQSVAIIFDCSGSMGQRLADGRTRLDAGRAAVAEILTSMAKSGRWDVSLWLYGHRTKWSRDKEGKYVAGLTNSGTAAKAAAERAGMPFTLVPGDDVEQVLPMQALTPAAVERIGMTLAPIEPGGETPLYLAISEALATDFDRGRTDIPGHVLVVTDGANDQTGGRFVTAAAVEDQLARKNGRRRVPLRIDVVGFGFASNSTDRASRMDDVRNLAMSSGGRFFEAANAETLAKSLRESLRVMQWRVRGPEAPQESVGLGSSIMVPPPLAARPQAFEAVLESGASPPRCGFEAEGGEALDLYVSGGGRRLEFRRYDGGTEQGLRDSRTNLFAPSDPQRLCFVGAHLASRGGESIRFPLSIQNANAAEFSPRPTEAWVEITPRFGDGSVGAPFVFYDLSFQQNRPVPVLDLLATRWPSSADRAEIRAWFRFTKMPPDVTVALSELTPGVERRLDLPSLPGSEIRVTLAPAEAADHVKLSMLESHPAPLADKLPCLRVCVSPDCIRAVHIVEPETGRVRHEFTVRTEGGRVPHDSQLLITDKQRVLNGAVSLTAAGEGQLTVPVPAE